MSKLKRLSLLTVVVLAVVGYAAVPASADITLGDGGAVYSDCVAGGTLQDCPVKGVRSGAAPTLVAGSTTITCQTANTTGVMDGAAPATGTLSFTWGSCTTQGAVPCTVNAINNVPVSISEANAPSATITNTATAGTTITCGVVFVCNAQSTIGGGSPTPVSAEVDQASQIATIADVVNVSGSVGCPASGTGTWNAQYLITDNNNNDLDLWATG
jgi:hypothetical protein